MFFFPPGNLSPSQLIFASVRLLMIRQRRTLEGEIIPHHIYDMETTHLRNGQLFFPRPNVIEHIINTRSPLYGIQRSTLASQPFEIVAIIEGSFDYTGFSCHFRTSYLPDELLWGYQFSSCNSTLSGFDFKKFNKVELVDAHPFWNYLEDETENKSPTTPVGSLPIFSKHFTKLSAHDDLPGQKPLNQLQPVTERLSKMDTIDSIVDASPDDSVISDVDEEQRHIDKLPLCVEHAELE
jgi:hypothetical protein